MQIAGRTFSDEILARIRSRVRDEPTLTRTALSREVCGWMGWHDPLGRPKDMSCRVALLKLARRGVIELPESTGASFGKPGEPADSAPWRWLTIETKLAALGPIRLIPVDSGQAELSQTWWAMMRAHHPLGAGPLCGAQLRYLVACEAGWLGGLSFSAPAWRLAPRDAWISWDDATRQAGLSQVVANSRFLIVPGVKVPHLASHVLGQALKRLAQDWQRRYGVTPVLVETFVDRSRYRGTCYRAANWILLGQTQGRGRQDRRHAHESGIKDIWMYPLQTRWQAALAAHGVAPPARRRTPADWAEEEFGDCRLPDARLQARLLSLARDFYARPMARVPQACGTRAKTKAAYRFLDHEHTTLDILLQPHYRATEARLQEQAIMLAVQDTTSLNTVHAATEGIGPIGSQACGPQGLHLHSTLAFSPQARARPWGFSMGSAGRAMRRTLARRRSVIACRSRRRKASSG